jgi:pSer/pThr/pTyr-binding forkhead associated (FHA) protein
LRYQLKRGTNIMWKLRFLSDVDGANVIDLVEAGITIGRDPENILCIEHSSLSKFHAVLVRNGSDYKIFDVHSTNGTYVNGQRITFASLRNGDKVRLGNIELEYDSVVKRTLLRPSLGGSTAAQQPAVTPTIMQEPGSAPKVPVKVSMTNAPNAAVKPAPATAPASVPLSSPPAALSSTPNDAASADMLTSVPPPPPADAKSFIRTTPSTTQHKKSTSSSSKNIMSKLGIGQQPVGQPAPAIPVSAPPLPAAQAPVPASPPQPAPAHASEGGGLVIAKRPAGKLTIGGGTTSDGASPGGRKKIIITPRPPQG